jgi:hypothetical protein
MGLGVCRSALFVQNGNEATFQNRQYKAFVVESPLGNRIQLLMRGNIE